MELSYIENKGGSEKPKKSRNNLKQKYHGIYTNVRSGH